MRLSPTPAVVASSLVALVALAACERPGQAVLAPIDVAVDNADAGPARVVGGGPPPSPALADDDSCKATLVTGRITSFTSQGQSDSCILDERVSHAPGVLSYPCKGDGPVTAVFESDQFEGDLHGGMITMHVTSELDFTDHCHWESNQDIVGSLTSKRLTWNYREHTTSGSRCAQPCRASAQMRVEDAAAPDDEDQD